MTGRRAKQIIAHPRSLRAKQNLDRSLARMTAPHHAAPSHARSAAGPTPPTQRRRPMQFAAALTCSPIFSTGARTTAPHPHTAHPPPRASPPIHLPAPLRRRLRCSAPSRRGHGSTAVRAVIVKYFAKRRGRHGRGSSPWQRRSAPTVCALPRGHAVPVEPAHTDEHRPPVAVTCPMSSSPNLMRTISPVSPSPFGRAPTFPSSSIARSGCGCGLPCALIKVR